MHVFLYTSFNSSVVFALRAEEISASNALSCTGPKSYALRFRFKSIKDRVMFLLNGAGIFPVFLASGDSITVLMLS